MKRSRRLTGPAMALAAAVFFGASLGMSLEVEPFYTWYYVFAWWSYILFVESVLHRQAAPSLLYEDPVQFCKLLPVSVTLWLFFELLNFRLDNWGYLNLPANQGLRWLGYAVSYATVLPALFATRELFAFLGFFKDHTIMRLKDPRPLLLSFPLIGGAMLLLPMAAPRLFFPLVWGSLVLLLEPVVYAAGGRSLLREWERGTLQTTLQLLTAGVFCGFLWELWNFWAGAKWFYTVPFVGGVKLFEMPVLGFLGFAPFALECWVAAQTFVALENRLMLVEAKRRRLIWAGLILAAVAFDLFVMHGIDLYTATTFSGSVS